MTQNWISYHKLQEEQRANRVQEKILQQNADINALNAQTRIKEYEESHRANVAREQQQQWYNSQIIAINAMQAAEQQRHNKAVETETNRYNVESLAEQYRSHVANEKETHRSNVAQEKISKANLTEMIRSNKQNELIKSLQLQEQIRANMVNEGIKSIANEISATKIGNEFRIAQSNLLLDQQKLGEQKRHNEAQESIAEVSNQNQFIKNSHDSYSKSVQSENTKANTDVQKQEKNTSKSKEIANYASAFQKIMQPAHSLLGPLFSFALK